VLLSKKYPQIYCALGIHPWFVNEYSVAELAVLENFIQREKIAAIGEIGLDFEKSYRSTRALQLEVFELQLELAVLHQLPVSIHAIKSHNETIALLKEYPTKGVIHGLGASVEVVQAYIDLGMKIGVNAVLCRENAVRYHKFVKHFGVSNFVLETDFPNILLPKHSEARLGDLEAIATMFARLKQLPTAEAIQQTGYNAQKLFLCK